MDTPARLCTHLTPPFAFCGIGIARAGAAPQFHTSTAPGIRATEHSHFRAASISKYVVARTVLAVTGDAGLDAPVAPLLGIDLQHPAYPKAPLTLRHLISHRASLNWEAGYLIPKGERLQDWLMARQDQLFVPHRPGSWFAYSNLGYILLAAATEALTGERFDQLSQRLVLGPLGIRAGFNWSGLDAAEQAGRLASYRRDDGQFLPQIDADRATSDIPVPYRPGQDTASLSPQGGLRLSLSGALRLAQSLEQADPRPLWRAGPDAGDTLNGVFAAYGHGLMIYDDPPFYPRPLIGHFAAAYGFLGGIWWDAQAGAAFCYGLNGLPVGDEGDGFVPEELAIFAAIAGELEK